MRINKLSFHNANQMTEFDVKKSEMPNILLYFPIKTATFLVCILGCI